MIGLIESIEPSIACAPPMRPPLRRYSSVSSAANTCWRSRAGFDLGHDLVEGGAVARASRRVQREVADAHRRAQRVDDLDRRLAVERFRRDLRRLHRRRQARRQVDADDAVGAVVAQAPERLFERADRRRRGLRQHRRRLQLAPERLDAQLLAVDELTIAEANGERDDLDAELLADRFREIARAVGHDANGHASSSVVDRHRASGFDPALAGPWLHAGAVAARPADADDERLAARRSAARPARRRRRAARRPGRDRGGEERPGRAIVADRARDRRRDRRTSASHGDRRPARASPGRRVRNGPPIRRRSTPHTRRPRPRSTRRSNASARPCTPKRGTARSRARCCRPFSNSVEQERRAGVLQRVEAAHHVEVHGERHEADRERLQRVGGDDRVVRGELVRARSRASIGCASTAKSTDAGSTSTTM